MVNLRPIENSYKWTLLLNECYSQVIFLEMFIPVSVVSVTHFNLKWPTNIYCNIWSNDYYLTPLIIWIMTDWLFVDWIVRFYWMLFWLIDWLILIYWTIHWFIVQPNTAKYLLTSLVSVNLLFMLKNTIAVLYEDNQML